MNIAIKLTRTHAPNSLLYSSSQHFVRNLKAPGGVKFQQSQAKPDSMEEADKAKPKSKHGFVCVYVFLIGFGSYVVYL